MNNENYGDPKLLGENKFPPPPLQQSTPLQSQQFQRNVVEIPVQHLRTESNQSSSSSIPKSHNYFRENPRNTRENLRDNFGDNFRDQYRNNFSNFGDNFRENSPFSSTRQDPFNQNIWNQGFGIDPQFELIDSPFQNFPFTSNPRQETDPRFPLISRFDDLFRRNQPDYPRNNSPVRDYLNPNLNPTRSHSQPRPSPPKEEKQEDRNRKEPSPITVIHNSSSNSSPKNTENITPNTNSDFELSSNSPKRYTTQTTIYPNTTQTQPQPTLKQQNLSSDQGPVPIKIEHLTPTGSSPTPNNQQNIQSNTSDFKYESDFGTQETKSNPSDTASKMGTTMSNAPNKQTGQTRPTPQFGAASKTPEAPKPQGQPQKIVKTPKDKCDEIQIELENLEKDINAFNGKKSDRVYLMIDEFLTRCLIKLDDIEKGDETFNQYRKSLINFANRLADKLESKCQNDAKETEESPIQTGSPQTLDATTNATNSQEESKTINQGAEQTTSELTQDSNLAHNSAESQHQ